MSCRWYKNKTCYVYTDINKPTMANRLVGCIINDPFSGKGKARYSNTIYPDVLKHEYRECTEEEVLKFIISNSINVAGITEQVNRRLSNGNQTS